jgi:hypothetical protein
MRQVRLAAVAGLLVAVTGCSAARERQPEFVAGASPSPPASPSRSVPPPRQPKFESGNDDRAVGDVIDTGLSQADGKHYVIVGVTGGAVYQANSFGFAIGIRESATLVTENTTISEYKGSASAAGFHPMQGQMRMEDGSWQPGFGYYVGDPVTISVVDSGHTIKAKLARWSHDPGVTVFWFDPADVTDITRWTDMGAYDAAGKRLPDGHIQLWSV